LSEDCLEARHWL